MARFAAETAVDHIPGNTWWPKWKTANHHDGDSALTLAGKIPNTQGNFRLEIVRLALFRVASVSCLTNNSCDQPRARPVPPCVL